ncbi:hypothetical protein PHISP_00327 [Aspergillus sp. HF37]|nr:hypothetical protein PHISP_00327 [Aspergillus sp. HF37]
MAARRAHSGPEQAQKPSAPRVRLSCAICHQRKVRCDKRIPCTNCQRLSITCVPVERARLPRGRSRKSAAQFNCDTAELVRDSGNSRSQPANGTGSRSANLPSISVLQHGSWNGSGNGLDVQNPGAYLGSSLWADLLDQVRGTL